MPLVVECGVIDFGAHTVKRWLNLQAGITNLIETYSPEMILIETNFVYKNIKSTAGLNQLRGAIKLIAALKGIKVEDLDNNATKKYILGGTRYWDPKELKYTSVTKDMMLAAVKKALCGESILPQEHDAGDAVALALTYYQAPLVPIPLARKPKS
jgi:Holliday junction resolvasome RuvABC endonuclease subunit